MLDGPLDRVKWKAGDVVTFQGWENEVVKIRPANPGTYNRPDGPCPVPDRDRAEWRGGLEPRDLHLGHAIVALLAFPFLVLALALAAGLERVWPRR